MEQVWNEIKTWMEANAPDLLIYLAPPASIEDIQDAESKLNTMFPEAVKDFYIYFEIC